MNFSSTITGGGTITAGAGSFTIGFNGRGVISSPGAGFIQLGATNAGAPVAQSLTAQSGSGSNVNGQNFTIAGYISTGTGADGDMIFQTGIKNGSSGSTAGTPTTALTLKAETQNIVLNGSAYATCTGLTTSSNVLTCTVSDKRLKNDEGIISPVDALAKILAMPDLHKYTFKTYQETDRDNKGRPFHVLRSYGPEGQHYSFFAQDVQKHLSELVTHTKVKTPLTPDGEYQFDKNEVVGLLVASQKAEQVEIKKQQAEIAALHVEIALLSKRRAARP